MGSIIYAAIAAACLYIYLMHLVKEEATRVSHLGLLCAIVTIIMQASPLADVVCVYINGVIFVHECTKRKKKEKIELTVN